MSKEQLKELRDLIGAYGYGESTEIAVLIAEASPTLIEEIDRLSMALEQAVKLTGLELDSDVIDAHGCSGASPQEWPDLAQWLEEKTP